ncbi:hypothetical protein MMARJ_37020 [Mycobacterium marseillense]|uniref:Uncharacterized protein n=1 Tax=Mycobacterium marseillense TaxID=701042 RepID=A0ABM7JGD2_9MYCO|nr:hypothetical protein MMARJ_37020 [Mycobacterium marseillense]
MVIVLDDKLIVGPGGAARNDPSADGQDRDCSERPRIAAHFRILSCECAANKGQGGRWQLMLSG